MFSLMFYLTKTFRISQDKRHTHIATITLYADILHPVGYFYTEFSRGVETHFNYKLATAWWF